MANVSPNTVGPGTFVIHDSVRPPLPAGDYTLTVQQAIDVTSGNATIPGINPASWDFKIVGPRFTLPKDQQLSVFPPPDSSGAYADRLPQIVLQRRTLPYERRIVLTDSPSTTPPWLALVVLAEGEGQLVTNQPVDTAGLPDPEDQDATVQDVLRVSQTVVQAVFPTLTDLPWLTHVREVDMSDTELALGSDGWMSVVVANRLPVPGPPAAPGGPATPRRYGAFLISLEGHANDLPTVETPANTFGILRVYDDTTIALGVQTAITAQALPLESIVAARSLMTAATAEPAATPASATPAPAAPSAETTTTSAKFAEVSAAFTGRALTAAQPSQPVDAWSSSIRRGTLSVAASTTPSRAISERGGGYRRLRPGPRVPGAGHPHPQLYRPGQLVLHVSARRGFPLPHAAPRPRDAGDAPSRRLRQPRRALLQLPLTPAPRSSWSTRATWPSRA